MKTARIVQLGESRAADAFGNALGNSIVSAQITRQWVADDVSVFGDRIGQVLDQRTQGIVDGTTTALNDALAGFNQGNGARQFDNDRAFGVNSGLALAQFSEQTSNVFFDNTTQFLGDVLTRSHEQRRGDIALNGFRAERFRIGNVAAAADFAATGDTYLIDFESDAVVTCCR